MNKELIMIMHFKKNNTIEIIVFNAHDKNDKISSDSIVFIEQIILPRYSIINGIFFQWNLIVSSIKSLITKNYIKDPFLIIIPDRDLFIEMYEKSSKPTIGKDFLSNCIRYRRIIDFDNIIDTKFQYTGDFLYSGFFQYNLLAFLLDFKLCGIYGFYESLESFYVFYKNKDIINSSLIYNVDWINTITLDTLKIIFSIKEENQLQEYIPIICSGFGAALFEMEYQ
jgi:hypothetical protein